MNVFPVDSYVTKMDSNGLPVYDREYTAAELREVYSKFFTNGVFGGDGGQLLVSSNSTQGVSVASGSCIIEGAVAMEDTTRTLVLQAPHASLDRIDTVVVRLDLDIDKRDCDLYVVEGTPAIEPERPALTRTESVWELGLADIYVRTGTTSVSAERITDTRGETERCGWAAPFVTLDTTGYFNQLQAATTEAVEAMKDALDGTTAGKLQSDVEDLQETALIDKRGSISDLSIQALLGIDPGSYDVPAAVVNGPEGETGTGNIMLSHCSEDRVSSLLTYDNGNVYAACGSTADSGANWKRLADWESLSQKLLWEGSFNSGSITVPGISKYRLLSVLFRYGQVTFPVLCSCQKPSAPNFYGAAPWFSSSKQFMVFYVALALYEEDEVRSSKGAISRFYINPQGWTYGIDNDATIEAITGLI